MRTTTAAAGTRMPAGTMRELHEVQTVAVEIMSKVPIQKDSDLPLSNY
jgi:hypothetical protein